MLLYIKPLTVFNSKLVCLETHNLFTFLDNIYNIKIKKRLVYHGVVWFRVNIGSEATQRIKERRCGQTCTWLMSEFPTKHRNAGGRMPGGRMPGL